MAPSSSNSSSSSKQPGAASTPLTSEMLRDKTPISQFIAHDHARRVKEFENQLFASTNEAEKERLRNEIVRWSKPPTPQPRGEIQDGGERWYYKESFDVWNIKKGTEKERQFLALKYEEDKGRFIKQNHDYYFLLGGPLYDDIVW